MEFTGFPRHQLRAMGRLKGRYSSRPAQSQNSSGPHGGVKTPEQKPSAAIHGSDKVRLAAAPECPEAGALLDYLSQAASHLNREVIHSERLPSFAQITSPAVIVPPQRQRVVADEWATGFSAQPSVVQPKQSQTKSPEQTAAQNSTSSKNINRNFGLAESALQGLADLLTLEAGSLTGDTPLPTPDFVPCVRPSVDLGSAAPTSYEMLDSWLNTGRSACAAAEEDEEDELSIAFSLDEIETVALYADENPMAQAAQRFLGQLSTSILNAEDSLPAFSTTNASTATATATTATATAPETPTLQFAPPAATLPSIAHMRPALVRNHTEAQPKMELLPAGRRLESLENGAQIIKDSLGRVIEVRSPLGPILRTRYDEQGHLRFFVRTDQEGKIQSYGESDKQGVVVHDPEGRVRAAGESMGIDRVGRLSIVRKDGQFWSIDLARGFHVERRQMVDEDGEWKAITAVFAYDGFRMVTRFQTMTSPESETLESFAEFGAPVREEIRLYGRDGSCVQFDSEESIEELRPSRVWPPASRAVDKKYRNRWQAGTAWQAVREYLELLKSGSG